MSVILLLFGGDCGAVMCFVGGLRCADRATGGDHFAVHCGVSHSAHGVASMLVVLLQMEIKKAGRKLMVRYDIVASEQCHIVSLL